MMYAQPGYLIRQTGSIEAYFEKRVEISFKNVFAVKKGEEKKVQITERLKGVISKECFQTVYNTNM